MSKLSVSFTLGKASRGNANIEHNNRDFISSNVDITRVADNITYIRQDIQEVYDELFGDALQEYNNKQTRNDRKIHDYFQHISDDKRKETHFEILVQFGDIDTASVGSNGGNIATRMLDEYIRKFQARNPNLCIVNAVLHLDESTPHLHIDFVPFYTKGGQKGLSQGVSMRAALEEQGFNNQHKKMNGMIAWENSERDVMESILNDYGINRDVKGATHAHKSVPAYKESQDWKKLPKRKKRALTAEESQNLEVENSLLKIENDKLNSERNSVWKNFYYADSSKQIFVQTKLSELNIPYRESENGFEAQEYHVETIRKIEKQYKPSTISNKEVLRNTIDKMIAFSQSYDEFLLNMERNNYELKKGKYLAFKPKTSDRFIRVKSLGEYYTEQALRNRFLYNQQYENEVINRAGENNIMRENVSLELMTTKTMKQYIIVFKQNALPMRKLNKAKPFCWTNDAELDKLAELNKKINAGVTLESLRRDLKSFEEQIPADEEKLEKLYDETKFFKNLHDAGIRCYAFDDMNHSDLNFLEKHKVTPKNYHRIKILIDDNNAEIADNEKSLQAKRVELKDVSNTLTMMGKVANGTYIRSLIDEEMHRRQTNTIPNGVKAADGSNLAKVEAIGRKIAETNNPKPTEPVVQKQSYKPKTR